MTERYHWHYWAKASLNIFNNYKRSDIENQPRPGLPPTWATAAFALGLAASTPPWCCRSTTPQTSDLQKVRGIPVKIENERWKVIFKHFSLEWFEENIWSKNKKINEFFRASLDLTKLNLTGATGGNELLRNKKRNDQTSSNFLRFSYLGPTITGLVTY